MSHFTTRDAHPEHSESSSESSASQQSAWRDGEPRDQWWFPAGRIVLRGKSSYRWEMILGPLDDADQYTILSGRFESRNGIGWIRDEDVLEESTDANPSRLWYEKLSPFPECHWYHDDTRDGDPSWFCQCGIWENSLEEVKESCVLQDAPGKP